MRYYIYIDGSCVTNHSQRAGGFAVIVEELDNITTISGCTFNTTNNIMELYALKRALIYILSVDNKQEWTIVSDSKYVVQGCNEWLFGWKRNQWKKSSSNKIIENLELWKDVDNLLSKIIKPKILWIKAHTGDNDIYSIGNSHADYIAQLYCQSIINK